MKSFLPIWALLTLVVCACATSRKAEQLQAGKPAAVLALPEQYTTSFREIDLPTLAQDSAAAQEFQGREVIVTLQDILGIRLLKKQKIPEHILPLSGLMVRKFRNGIVDCIIKSKRTLLSDLSMLPMNWYDQEISCYTECDDRVNGFLLVHVTPSKRLRVELFSATGPDSRIDLLNMLRFSLRAAGERYGPETEVVLIRRDEAAKKLIGYLFPGRKGRRIFTGKREE